MSKKAYAVLALVLAGFLIFLGLQRGGDRATCSNRVMKPDETCTQLGRHSTITRGYEQQKSYQNRLRWMLWGTAGLLIVGAPIIVRGTKGRDGT